MKEIIINNNIIEKIKSGKATHIILDEEIDCNEELILKCNNNSVRVLITGKSKYRGFDDCFKIIPVDLFGLSSVDEANDIYFCDDIIRVYRIKYTKKKIGEITNKDILDLINISSLKRNNIGYSSIDVYEVTLKNGLPGILKVQSLSSRNNLFDEYNRIKFLQGKCMVPKIYGYFDDENGKYLLMEKLKGIPAYETDKYAFQIGKALREFHEIEIDNCEYIQNSIDNLLDNTIKNIDIIIDDIMEIYPDMNKDMVIDFLINNKPTDKVLVHGDFSLPNIIIDEDGKIGLIDLGDVSISSKYFDFFYLKKSLIRNNKINNLDKILDGYGIDKLDNNYLKWMEIVDTAL